MQPIYLDYNATTPIAPSVQEAMLPFLAEHFGNPSSTHVLGRAAHAAIDDARWRVARMLNAQPDEIIFTSGGTEANNLAIIGSVLSRGCEQRGHLVISAVEHPAVVEPARFLERLGYRLTVVGTDRTGLVDPEAVAEAIGPDTLLVSIMHGNNEIGTLEPVAEIARLCRSRGVLVHTDAAQSVGKVPVQVEQLGVDLLSIAGHKFYAPKGVGALYVRRGTPLVPVLRGAGHEAGLRPGTENTASIVALGRAAELAANHVAEAQQRLAQLRNRLLDKLQQGVGKKLSVNGDGAPRLPNTLSVNFPGVSGGDLLQQASGLCASTGSACHSGTTHLSATLAAIGLAPEVARGTVRLSVGWYTSEEEVDRAADALIAAWENIR